MLAVALRPNRTDTATTALPYYIDFLALLTAPLGYGLQESIRPLIVSIMIADNTNAFLIDAGSSGSTDSH